KFRGRVIEAGRSRQRNIDVGVRRRSRAPTLAPARTLGDLPRRRDFSTNGRKKVVAIAGHRPKDRRDRRVDPTAGYAARPSRGPVPKSAKITRFLIGARNAVYHREPTKKIPYPGTRAG